MSSDITFEKHNIAIKGQRIKIFGNNLELVSSERLRAANRADHDAKKPRRALVHGHKDDLIINYSVDYSATEIHGPLVIKAKRVPSSITVVSRSGKKQTFISQGIIDTERDLFIKSIEKISGDKSLVNTLKWLVKRVRTLEQAQGIATPDKLDPQKG